MKDKNFVIKVGDLLKEGGKVDSITFEEKASNDLPNLSKEGISGKIILRSLNQDSLYVNLENVSCKIEEVCDRCGANYTRKVNAPEYVSRFVISEKIKKEEEVSTDEEIFVINARDETIDLEPMILQSIVLGEPFIKHCPKCEKEVENESDDEDIEEDVVGSGNVVFH